MSKPTILLALDPHSAAFCAAIKQQLQTLSTTQSSFIQTYTLTWDGQAFSFSADNEQLRTVIIEYQKASNAKIAQAAQIRALARTRAREQAEEAIVTSLSQLTATENQLEAAIDKQNELLAEDKRFRNQYLVIYPTFIATLLLGFVILMGIFSQSTLWFLLEKIGENLVNHLLWTTVAILIYLGLVWLKYSTTIRDYLLRLQKQIKRLESSLKANAVELRRNYNEKLKLEYDFYAQNLRVETLNDLIKKAKQRNEALHQTLNKFYQIYQSLVQEREQAKTNSSETRLTVITDADIDTYYQNFLKSMPTEKFTQEKVSRSQSWKISAEDFHNQLIPFAQEQFEPIRNLSIGAVLKQSDLISPNTSTLRLNQLHDSSNLLLRLQDIDANLNPTSQRETKLWVAPKDKEQIFSHYSRLSRTLTTLEAEDELRVCILTRSLGFPAYFLSQIEFYRDCYERAQSEQKHSDELESIPDLIPEEIGSSRELKQAYQTLLLGIALELVSQSQGNYKFKSKLLGTDREQIALTLATEFTFQELYGELKESIEKFEHNLIYEKLQHFGAVVCDLTSSEYKFLDHLLLEYNPLN